jgi:hypothetical protein
MTVRYEWQERRGGRRYRRIVERDEPVKDGGKVIVEPEAVAEAEAVPEVKIDAEDGQVKPKRGRPKKADAPVVIEDSSDD